MGNAETGLKSALLGVPKYKSALLGVPKNKSALQNLCGRHNSALPTVYHGQYRGFRNWIIKQELQECD